MTRKSASSPSHSNWHGKPLKRATGILHRMVYEATRELLALRIIEVARSSGVRDYAHLRDDALLYLARASRRSTGRESVRKGL
jgi:hypothetical protein